MENFIYAVIILALILVFTAVNSVIICNICDNIIDLLDQGQKQEACDLWESRRFYISLFVRDAEIDVVDAAVKEIEKKIAVEDGEAESLFLQFREAIAEVKYSESTNWESIF